MSAETYREEKHHSRARHVELQYGFVFQRDRFLSRVEGRYI